MAKHLDQKKEEDESPSEWESLSKSSSFSSGSRPFRAKVLIQSSLRSKLGFIITPKVCSQDILFVSAVLYDETLNYVSGFIYSGLFQFDILSVYYLASFPFCLSITRNSSVVRNAGTSRPSRHYIVSDR